MNNKDIKIIRSLMKPWGDGLIKIKKAGGQTNKNFIIEHNGRKYFVRIPWERKDIIDRKAEAKNILAISRNKKLKDITPQYLLFIYNGRNILRSQSKEKFRAPGGTMITEYIPGKIFTLSLFRQKKYQQKLAEMFHVFHSSNVAFANKYDVFKDEIEKYRLATIKYPVGEIIRKEIIEKMEKIEKEAKKRIPILREGTATHNDFIFQNFLVDDNGKIYLLDFEYAGLNRRGGIIYDFGFLFADNFFRRPKMTQKLFEEFLSAADKIYGRRLDREKIYCLSAAAVLVMFWWGIVRYFSVKRKKEKRYFKDYILKRAREVDDILLYLKKKGIRLL